MTSAEYFYFEWLIVEKQMTLEMYSSLSDNEIQKLIIEYSQFAKQLN